MKTRDRIIPGLLLLVALSAVVWSYQPSLSGRFVFDDTINISNIPIDPVHSPLDTLSHITFGNGSGPLGRPVAMFSFGVQMIATGLDPFPLKLANLALHALNGVILFFLGWAIAKQLDFDATTAAWIAALTATLWLVHPINLTAVAYIVQRMTSLSALFTALAVLSYVNERAEQQRRRGRWFTSLALVTGFGLLAVFSKENGLLLPVYLIVAEFFLFRFKAANSSDVRTLKILTLIVVASMILILVVYFALHFNASGAYASRGFDLTERVLTESRIVVWYLTMILVPDVQQMTLYHDGIQLSTGLLAPPTTLLALLTLLTLLVSTVWLRQRAAWYGFGVVFFLTGHLLESTVFPLELVFEHRNYLPSFGILFAVVVGGAMLLRRLTVPTRYQVVVPVFFILLLSITTHTRAYQWSGDPAAPLLDALNHPESPRANIIAGNTYSVLAKGARDAKERSALIKLADDSFQQADDLLPDSANALFGWLFLYYEHNIDPPRQLVETLPERLGASLIDTTTVNGLHSLTTCEIDGHCRMAETDYLATMKAALDNPRLAHGAEAPILRDLARFHAQGQQDYKRAASVSQRASALDRGSLDRGSLEVRVEAIHYLTNSGQILAALDALEQLEQADRRGRFSAEIPQWRSLLEAAAPVQAPP